MPAAVSVVDAHGRLVLVNARYERTLGSTAPTALWPCPCRTATARITPSRAACWTKRYLETGYPLALPYYDTLVTGDRARAGC